MLTIYTLSKSFNEWCGVLDDSVMVSAVLERVLHISVVININGNSYRLKYQRERVLPTER